MNKPLMFVNNNFISFIGLYVVVSISVNIVIAFLISPAILPCKLDSSNTWVGIIWIGARFEGYFVVVLFTISFHNFEFNSIYSVGSAI